VPLSLKITVFYSSEYKTIRYG